MRKLIISMNMTLDGFVADSDGGLDWHLPYWTSELAFCLEEELAAADCLLLGRRTFEAMSAYWPQRSIDINLSRDDVSYTDMMNSYRKYVVGREVNLANWHNSEKLRGTVKQGTRRLKDSYGKDILVYGSPSLVVELVKQGLVDEFHCWLYPIFLCKGLRLFPAGMKRFELQTYRTTRFETGVLGLYYRFNGQVVGSSRLRSEEQWYPGLKTK